MTIEQFEGCCLISGTLDFGHVPRNQIAGKWQPDEGFIVAV
jgi:hypothetical protein